MIEEEGDRIARMLSNPGRPTNCMPVYYQQSWRDTKEKARKLFGLLDEMSATTHGEWGPGPCRVMYTVMK